MLTPPGRGRTPFLAGAAAGRWSIAGRSPPPGSHPAAAARASRRYAGPCIDLERTDWAFPWDELEARCAGRRIVLVSLEPTPRCTARPGRRVSVTRVTVEQLQAAIEACIGDERVQANLAAMSDAFRTSDEQDHWIADLLASVAPAPPPPRPEPDPPGAAAAARSTDRAAARALLAFAFEC
ncbi:MAG: hypothetical protein ABIY55_23880 [Kofleriaceae bacterium]